MLSGWFNAHPFHDGDDFTFRWDVSETEPNAEPGGCLHLVYNGDHLPRSCGPLGYAVINYELTQRGELLVRLLDLLWESDELILPAAHLTIPFFE